MLSDLQGKKIAIVGMGVNNQALAAYLKAKKIAFDVIEKWSTFDELTGKLAGYEIIFRTPGLPFKSPPIADAIAKGVKVSSQTKLFFELCPAPIVGVTGTKGKGTTASLIAKIIETDGKKKVWLAGNIGQDPFEFLDQIKPDDIVVLELSSFQLQDLGKSPHIAVVLNITRDHIDESKSAVRATHYSFDEYFSAKAQIVAHQNPDDFAVLSSKLPDSFNSQGLGKKIIAEPQDAATYETKLLGRHNLENISAAIAVAKILGIDERTTRKAVASFEGLPYRLQVLGTFDQIRYINDGYSTNIEPVMAAVEAMDTDTILVVGGFNKHLDFSPLGELIKNSPKIKGVVAIGQETPKIVAALAGYKGKILTGASNIKEILDQAESLAHPGYTILFSPGTSSFDMFANEKDRSEQFSREVIARHS
ncbi:MAG TPA: UDP-N-acetylmuramoyl-L-alanine--D-glutamate ligase [Patescibacteria group bacterium]|jgi:UDP-N-acetylmuramoylalanine--D-glutamate ligase|nr:UDP-N-acetylmuramoyl-L-alanine--D-glutamate ligase [Patescibacteria group bacterium]